MARKAEGMNVEETTEEQSVRVGHLKKSAAKVAAETKMYLHPRDVDILEGKEPEPVYEDFEDEEELEGEEDKKAAEEQEEEEAKEKEKAYRKKVHQTPHDPLAVKPPPGTNVYTHPSDGTKSSFWQGKILAPHLKKKGQPEFAPCKSYKCDAFPAGRCKLTLLR